MLTPSDDPGYELKEALLAGLRAQQWRPGQKLPTERQMSVQYRVGRAAVRRTLGELKQLGLIAQIVGSGTYVAKDIADRLPPLDGARTISPADLMQARLIFEPTLTDLIIRNATTSDFAELEACCRHADTAATLTAFEHWDNAFHQGLARATHNGFVITVFMTMAKIRDEGEWGILKQRSATPERRAQYQREHWALLAALRNRDAEIARDAWADHLLTVRRNMFD